MTKMTDIQPGSVLVVTDADFTCLTRGQLVTVCASDGNGLYVPCDRGCHYLEGQVDGVGNLIGLTLASDPDPIPGAR